MKTIDIVKVVQVRESGFDVERVQIRSAADAAAAFQRYLDGADREHFVVAALNTKHVINAIHTVSIGSLDASIVHPREVLKFALLANASGIIACHNHPSGQSHPSQEDVQVTKRLVEAGRIIGIDVLDHIVLGDDSYSSLKELGLM